MECARCGNTSNFFMQMKGAQTGLYCKQCLRWQKWVGKKDIDSYRRRGIALVSPTASIEPISVGVDTNTLVGVKDTGLEPEKALGNEQVQQVVMGTTVQDMKEQEKEIELRVQARVEIELAKVRAEYETKEKEVVEDKGCTFCRGEEGLEGEEAKVEVGLYSGLMAITTKNGETVQGFFPVSYCMKCGKKQ